MLKKTMCTLAACTSTDCHITFPFLKTNVATFSGFVSHFSTFPGVAVFR